VNNKKTLLKWGEVTVKFRKPFVVMSCAAMMTSVLYGCSTKTEEPVKQPQASGQATSVPKQEPTKIKVALETGGLKYVEQSSDINSDKYVKKLEELANVDLNLQLIQHTNYEQNLTLLMAGGELPDLLQTHGINTPQIAPAIDAGQLLPLNDLIDKYGPNLKKNVPKESWDSAKVSKDGKIYGIPQPNPIRVDTVTYIRKDWLNKIGMAEPKTVDDYIKMLTAFRDQDPNGNGKKDEIPFSARAKLSFGYAFFGAYDVQPQAWKFIDGQLVPNLIRPEMVDALKIYQKLYAEKLIDNEVLVNQGKDWDAKIKAQAIVGMWAHSSAQPDSWSTSVKAGDPKAELAVIASPVGPSGKPGGIYSMGSTVSDFVWTISKNAKDPAAIIKFLDWYYATGDKAKDDFFVYGLKGTDYTEEGGKVKYNYPTTDQGNSEQFMHQEWIHFTGPKTHLTDPEYIKNKPGGGGDMIHKSLAVAAKEGLVDDGLDMPTMPSAVAHPELKYDGLWLEFAAKVMTGKESADKFNDFVADWKKRGGDQLIKEATEWYNKMHKK
jgi:putative aldouronate transport system substrate-binding protein